METHYRGSNELKLLDIVVKYISLGYQGKKTKIKNSADYYKQIELIKSLDIESLIPHRELNLYEVGEKILSREHTSIAESLSFIKGCFKLLDDECENEITFTNTERYHEILINTNRLKIYIAKMDFYNKEIVEIFDQ